MEEENLHKVHPTQTLRRAEAMKTHIMPRLRSDLSRQSHFSWLHYLFPKVKTALKGKKFQEVEDIRRSTTTELKAVLLEAFSDCFQKFFKQFNKCIRVGRDCFE
jgi:hypothetical protein